MEILGLSGSLRAASPNTALLFMVSRSHARFDADGSLIDDTTKVRLTELLDALQAKVRETEALTRALVA